MRQSSPRRPCFHLIRKGSSSEFFYNKKSCSSIIPCLASSLISNPFFIPRQTELSCSELDSCCYGNWQWNSMPPEMPTHRVNVCISWTFNNEGYILNFEELTYLGLISKPFLPKMIKAVSLSVNQKSSFSSFLLKISEQSGKFRYVNKEMRSSSTQTYFATFAQIDFSTESFVMQFV